MKDQNKTKQKLIEELEALRKQVTKLKDMETKRKKVEEALREAHERLQTIVRASPLAILAIDPAGRWNQK